MFDSISAWFISVWERLSELFTINFIEDDRYMYLVDGLGTTLTVTALSLLMGLVLGVLVAMVRVTYANTGKLKFLDKICGFYLTIIRGTPVTVQLMLIYFAIFASVSVSKTFAAVIGFGINSGAYVAEIMRGGLMSVDKGQMEAGRSLGLGYVQTMRLIIIPQALKNVLPALCNEAIALLKETSVVGFIGLADLTRGADIIRGRTYDAFMPMIAVALIYLVIVMILSKLIDILERRLRKSDSRS